MCDIESFRRRPGSVDMNALLFARLCWFELGLYWLVTARNSKETAVNENSGIRMFRQAILALVLILLLADWLWVGFSRRRFIPENSEVVWFGAALTFMAVQLAIWARYTLGGNWSDKVVLKVDHQLVQTGPYRYLRHPIYTGVILAVAGTALTVGQWRGIVAVILLAGNYFVKATREEKLLASNFGEAFANHKRRTGFFLPGL
jgi:protein-S-isoprenylcysteine O-methyltransferase Ste14